MAWMLPAATIAAPLLGGAAGSLFGGKKKDVAGEMLKKATDQLNAIHTPTVDEQKVILQNYVQQGILTPEQYQAELQNLNNYDTINLNPAYRNAQEKSLSEVGNIVDSGGLDDIDRAKINDIISSVGAAEKGRLSAVQQDAARRGISGSGIELGAELQGDAEARNHAYDQGMNTAALATQRRMDALKTQADLGSNLENSQYKMQADKAAAANAIQAANANASNAANQWNAQTKQNTNVANLDTKQGISNLNTQGANTNALRNSGLIQDNFDNQVKKATAALQPTMAAATNAQNVSNSNAAGQNALFTNIGGSLGKAASDYYATKKPQDDLYV